MAELILLEDLAHYALKRQKIFRDRDFFLNESWLINRFSLTWHLVNCKKLSHGLMTINVTINIKKVQHTIH